MSRDNIRRGKFNMTIVQNPDPNEIVQGLFALKHLVLFTKFINLCPQIELFKK